MEAHTAFCLGGNNKQSAAIAIPMQTMSFAQSGLDYRMPPWTESQQKHNHTGSVIVYQQPSLTPMPMDRIWKVWLWVVLLTALPNPARLFCGVLPSALQLVHFEGAPRVVDKRFQGWSA
jgi:hypothetical protein